MKTLKLIGMLTTLIISMLGCSQKTKTKKNNTNKPNKGAIIQQYNTKIRLFNNDSITFSDGLKIKLVGFSHKLVYENQISPGISHLEISKNELENITLSSQKYKDEHNNIITSYTTTEWKNYSIELKALDYDKTIDIIVSKLKE